jgi:hypothetical protein
MNTSRSSAGSVKSKGSKASERSVGRYKKVSQAGGADESLFGAHGAKGGSDSGSRGQKLEQMTRQAPSNVNFDSCAITAQELARLRMAADPGAVGKSADDRLRAENMAAKVQAQEKAKARKEKMLAMEATRKAKLPKTDLEQEDENAMSQLLGSAQQAKDESLDMVKSMNRQVQYAKCATIRDAQLIEKQMLLKQQQEEEAESFRRMEEERIKALQLMEEREEQKRQERMRGAQIIQMQIRQREEEKLREAGSLFFDSSLAFSTSRSARARYHRR